MDIRDCSKFADESVSHMLASLVVPCLGDSDRSPAIEGIKKKLVPDGVFAFSTPAGGDVEDLLSNLLKVRPDLVGMEEPPAHWREPDGVREHLESIGFKFVEVVQIDTTTPFDNYDTMCRFILNQTPWAEHAVQQMTNAQVRQTLQMMVADLTAKCPTLPGKVVEKVTMAYCQTRNTTDDERLPG